MAPTLHQCRLLASERMPPHDVTAVLTTAGTLQRAARAGTMQPLLRGKHLALVGDAADTPEAALFRRSAVELGAQVTHVRPGLNDASAPDEVQRTARMLGRLYDAVECQGMSAPLVAQIAQHAGIPVYEAVAAQHPSATLADLLAGDAPAADKRKFILQALLIGTLI